MTSDIVYKLHAHVYMYINYFTPSYFFMHCHVSVKYYYLVLISCSVCHVINSKIILFYKLYLCEYYCILQT